MKQEACECGAALKICHDSRGLYDNEVVALFNSLHSGNGHERVDPAEANRIRHFYGARVDRKIAAARARENARGRAVDYQKDTNR